MNTKQKLLPPGLRQQKLLFTEKGTPSKVSDAEAQDEVSKPTKAKPEELKCEVNEPVRAKCEVSEPVRAKCEDIISQVGCSAPLLTSNSNKFQRSREIETQIAKNAELCSGTKVVIGDREMIVLKRNQNVKPETVGFTKVTSSQGRNTKKRTTVTSKYETNNLTFPPETNFAKPTVSGRTWVKREANESARIESTELRPPALRNVKWESTRGRPFKEEHKKGRKHNEDLLSLFRSMDLDEDAISKLTKPHNLHLLRRMLAPTRTKDVNLNHTPKDEQPKNTQLYEPDRGKRFRDFLYSLLRKSGFSETMAKHIMDDSENIALFTKAFNHSSYSSNNYECLEFIGNDIVNLQIVRYVFNRFSLFQLYRGEKKAARLRIKLVSKQMLASYANTLGFEEFIGTSLEEKNTNKRSLLEDSFEAFIAALSLVTEKYNPECGYSPSRILMKYVLDQQTDMSLNYDYLFDEKTQLKELFDHMENVWYQFVIEKDEPNDCKSNIIATIPRYKVSCEQCNETKERHQTESSSETGQYEFKCQNDKTHKVYVSQLEPLDFHASGTGADIKESQKSAAREAMLKLKELGISFRLKKEI